MMRTRTSLAFVVAGVMALATTDITAQLSFGGRPWAQHAEKIGLDQPPVFAIPALDRAALFAEDEVRAAAGNKRMRFGVNHATDLSLDNSGVWNTLPNGDRVWRLRLALEGALSINFEFNEFIVPEGAMVFAYTPSGERIGGFTADSNPGRTELGVGLLPGGEITIEYNEPAAVAGQGRLRIGQITQGYRDSFNLLKGFNESLDCNNNVICEVGDPWRDQIRSVARIVVGGGDWCTGQLINNCNNDGTPYFLTADHCLEGNVGTWVFAFNWESTNCANNVNTPMNETVSGAQLLENNPGSDMALLQLNTAPPASYEVYYSGWDATNTPPQDQIGIHHPSGDQKKISLNGETSLAAPYGGASTWEVDAWDDGTTEGGSSGSGLWNQNGLLVGQLFGGTFGCNCTDYYGRFDVSYPFIDDIIGTCGPVLLGYDPNQTSLAVDGSVQSISGIPAIVCNSNSVAPQVTIRNAGTDPLTSLVIAWQVTGGANGQQPWNGNLNPGATTTITLPALAVGNGSQTLTVTASQPNGIADPNALNNVRTVNFTVASPATLADLSITLDDYGSETTWELLGPDNNEVLFSGGPYSDGSDGQEENSELCLAEGCYTFVMFDDASDGICCGYGEGFYSINASGTVLVDGDGEFGDTIDHDFCITSTGLVEQGATDLHLRPNPTYGRVELILPTHLGPAQVAVFDGTGRRVLQARTNGMNGVSTLDLTGQPAGIYLVKVITAENSYAERLVVRP